MLLKLASRLALLVIFIGCLVILMVKSMFLCNTPRFDSHFSIVYVYDEWLNVERCDM
jgi:hypothetical protein